MNILRLCVFQAVFFTAACAQELKQNGEENQTAEHEHIVQALNPWIESGMLNGVVRVEQKGEVVFAKAYGQANHELGVPNSETTIFKLHSMSKSITAAAALRATAQNLLDVNDSICDYLATCPEHWRQVSVRHLLNHSSGIPDFSGLLMTSFETDAATTLGKISADLSKLELAFEPGTAFRYSNSGYVLLTVILETVYDAPFSHILQTQIFDPVGMPNSGIEISPPSNGGYDGPLIVDGMASGYNGSIEKLQQAYSKMYVIPGAGGVYSTAQDVANFANALFKGGLLPAESLEEMVRRDPAIGVDYGYGIVVKDTEEGVYYRHDGGNNGFLSWMQYYPGQDLLIVIVTNYGFAPINDIRQAIQDAIIHEPQPQ